MVFVVLVVWFIIDYMIPKFPNFKKIDLEDREVIESFTHKYQPYSDFNFTSLWSWDIKNERMISELNGNLVVRFTDYETCEPFFSFLGTNETENTVRELVHFAEKSGVSAVLRLVPEESVTDLSGSEFLVEEDRDNFDYVFNVSELASLRGVKFKGKRHSADKFSREYPDAHFEIKKINSTEIHEQIISVSRHWKDKKIIDKKNYDFEYEEMAIKRLLQAVNDEKLILSCVFLHKTMIGFSVDEISPFQYATSHFIKADISYKGIYDFLNKNLAQYFLSRSMLYWNWEQDLGIEYIKKSKTSYHPVNFLKKYKISVYRR